MNITLKLGQTYQQSTHRIDEFSNSSCMFRGKGGMPQPTLKNSLSVLLYTYFLFQFLEVDQSSPFPVNKTSLTPHE